MIFMEQFKAYRGRSTDHEDYSGDRQMVVRKIRSSGVPA